MGVWAYFKTALPKNDASTANKAICGCFLKVERERASIFGSLITQLDK